MAGKQKVLGSNPVDLYGWEDADEDLTFAHVTSLSGQFAQQWKLRMMAQEATLKEITNSRLRRLLAFNKSFTCTDVKTGDTVLFSNAKRKKSAPRRRGPVLISDIDEAGATAKFKSEFFKVARFWVRKQGEEKDVEDAELDPVRARFRRIGSDLGGQLRQVDVETDLEVDRGGWELFPAYGHPGERFWASTRNDSGTRFPIPDGTLAVPANGIG